MNDYYSTYNKWFIKFHLLIMNNGIFTLLWFFLFFLGIPTILFYKLTVRLIAICNNTFLLALCIVVEFFTLVPFVVNLLMVYLDWIYRLNEDYWTDKLIKKGCKNE